MWRAFFTLPQGQSLTEKQLEEVDGVAKCGFLYPMAKALTGGEIQAALATLDGWRQVDGQLQKDFKFPDFKAAMGFLMRMAFEAEKLDHHPEIYNVYNKVLLSLSTHEAGGQITEKDIHLARAIEKLD